MRPSYVQLELLLLQHVPDAHQSAATEDTERDGEKHALRWGSVEGVYICGGICRL